MARSEEALLRRAKKRQRTEEEQRQADRQDMMEGQRRKRMLLEKEKKKEGFQQHQQQDDQGGLDPMKEFGAWICPSCGNHNFASRRWCNSKTCDERRPFDPQMEDRERRGRISQQHQPRNGGRTIKRPRHDPETSKPLVWAKQANQSTLSKNQALRRRYQETGGEGMEEEEILRAKILLARDERKRQKKQQAGQTKKALLLAEKETSSDSNNDNNQKTPEGTLEASGEETQAKAPTTGHPKVIQEGVLVSASSLNRSKRDKNQTLRQRYLETGGKGMSQEQVDRAKVLIARDARKRRKESPKHSEATPIG